MGETHRVRESIVCVSTLNRVCGSSRDWVGDSGSELVLCAVLEMEREKAKEEERLQNELRQRKKMEKERKREELARQKEKKELRKREEEEEGVCVCTQECKQHTHHINSNKPHLHTMCQLVSHGCLLYIVPEDPTMDRTSCVLQGYLLSRLISCHCVPLFLAIAITSCCPPSLLCPPKGNLSQVMRM